MKRASLLLILLVLISIQSSKVLAQSAPSCSYQPDGSIICTTGGGNDGGGGEGGGEGNGNGNSNGGEAACTPGNHMAFHVLDFDASTNTCKVHPIRVDNCTERSLEFLNRSVPCLAKCQILRHPNIHALHSRLARVVLPAPTAAGRLLRELLFLKSIWMCVPTPQLWCAGRPLSEMVACQSLLDQAV